MRFRSHAGVLKAELAVEGEADARGDFVADEGAERDAFSAADDGASFGAVELLAYGTALRFG